MKTIDLLEKLNFKPDQVNGFYFDLYEPKEFILNIFKDCGAERWKLYGDKENFSIALGDARNHQIISACPMNDVAEYISNFLSRGEDAEKNTSAFNKFLDSSQKLTAPEEPYSESAIEFLSGEKEKTLEATEIKTLVNKFRVKSGHEAIFNIDDGGSVSAVKCNIQSIRKNAFATPPIGPNKLYQL